MVWFRTGSSTTQRTPRPAIGHRTQPTIHKNLTRDSNLMLNQKHITDGAPSRTQLASDVCQPHTLLTPPGLPIQVHGQVPGG